MTDKTDKAKTLVDKELLGDGIPAKPRRRSRGFMRGLLRFLSAFREL